MTLHYKHILQYMYDNKTYSTLHICPWLPYLAVDKESPSFLLVQDPPDVCWVTFLIKGQELERVLHRLEHNGAVPLDPQSELTVRATTLLQQNKLFQLSLVDIS